MRRALPGALVLSVAIAMAVGADRTAAQATARVERTPQLFIVRVPGAFDDVLAVFLEEIKRRNYVVTGVNHLDDALARRAAETGLAPLGYERLDSLKKANGKALDYTVCSNTTRGMKVEKSEIVEFVHDLYPGIVRILELREKGYVYIRP